MYGDRLLESRGQGRDGRAGAGRRDRPPACRLSRRGGLLGGGLRLGRASSGRRSAGGSAAASKGPPGTSKSPRPPTIFGMVTLRGGTMRTVWTSSFAFGKTLTVNRPKKTITARMAWNRTVMATPMAMSRTDRSLFFRGKRSFEHRLNGSGQPLYYNPRQARRVTGERLKRPNQPAGRGETRR